MYSTTWSGSRPAGRMPENIMFLPECHVDTALARVLVESRPLQFINHKHGISQVANALRNQAATGRGARLVVGLVDRDKNFAQNHYLSQFGQPFAMRTGPDCGYSIYRHPQVASHFLIVLDPACDRWIFEAAQAAQLDLTAFGLPPTLAGFIDFTKDERAERNPKLLALLQAIRRTQPSAYRELAEFVSKVVDPDSTLWQ